MSLTTAQAAEDTSPQLVRAVNQSQKELNPLEPWQKKIFDEEVATQPLLFIRNFQAIAGGELKADVDIPAIRNYLKFHLTPPVTPPAGGQNIGVLLRAEPSCEKCTQVVPILRPWIKARLERRGLIPQFFPVTDLGDAKWTAKALEQKALDLSTAKGWRQTLVVSWQSTSDASEGGAHADEKRYLLRSFLALKGFAPVQREYELLANDSFETALAKLMVESWTEIGIKGPLSEPRSLLAAGNPEVWVTITGIRDFPTFSRVKAQLEALALKGLVFLGERKISADQTVFAYSTDLPLEEAKRQLTAARLGLANQPSLKVEVP